MKNPLRCAAIALSTTAATFAPAYSGILKNANPGFENNFSSWYSYIGPGIENTAKIEIQDATPGFTHGNKHLLLRLPSNARTNQTQYVTVGQYLDLDDDKQYEYSVRVKWKNPGNPLPSAIVSIWIKNENGTYSGRDHWLTDGQAQTLRFKFVPTADARVNCYISLLTHQDGFHNTDLLVDAFRIEEIGAAPYERDPRTTGQNLLSGSAFTNGLDSWTGTSNNPNSVGGLNRYITTVKGNKKLRLELPGASSTTYLNNTWTGVYQNVKLYAGNAYRISANVDRVVPDATQYPTIVNVYAFKPDPAQPAWLGDVDYKFNRADNHFYAQVIKPSETGIYQITSRVFGWGNDGRPLRVNIDNLQIRRIGP